MILLVSYDLNTPNKDYQSLYNLLKSAPGWWHHLESTWILATDENVNSWADKLIKVIDENDSVIVVDITGSDSNGWLPKKAWEWLHSHDQ